MFRMPFGDVSFNLKVSRSIPLPSALGRLTHIRKEVIEQQRLDSNSEISRIAGGIVSLNVVITSPFVDSS